MAVRPLQLLFSIADFPPEVFFRLVADYDKLASRAGTDPKH
jgi:hypothetical protein